MSHPATFTFDPEPLPDHEQKQAALSYLSEAWAEARHEGVDGDCLAQASLFAALAELVTPMARTPSQSSPTVSPIACATASSR